MKISDKKIEKIKQLLQDKISDVEITDVVIIPTGYREYEVESFTTNLDPDNITTLIRQILESEE